MDNNNRDVEKDKLLFDQITSADTISAFMEKCNNNFAKIISNNGGPKGDKGEQGNPGVPTKPKVSIHVWEDGVEYVNEYHDSDNNIFYIDDNNIKEDLTQEKYKVGHLIILENGNVYILENSESEKKLKPKFKLSLIVSSDIKNQIHNIESDINYIKSQKSGGVNLIDRTAFEIYENDKDNNLKDTYIITNKKNTESRSFNLYKHNLQNTTFSIKNKLTKSDTDNRIYTYTNSIKIDATDTTESEQGKTTNYSDITQLLNCTNDFDDTILKPNTVYTLYCKYKCQREKNSYVNYRGGLFITYVNTKWMSVDNVTVSPKSDLATLFHNDVIVDWKPIKITFETGSEIGQGDYHKGCVLHIRAMAGCWVEICDLKLEEGNMQTQWSESHSDIISRIKQASSSSSVNSNISISNIKDIYKNENENFYYIDLNNISDPCFNSDTIIINGDENDSDKNKICILLPTDKLYNKSSFIEYVSNNGKTIKIKNLSNNKCFVALPSKGESGKLYQINSKTPIHEENVNIITMKNGVSKYNSIEIGNNYSEFVCFNNNIWCQTK